MNKLRLLLLLPILAVVLSAQQLAEFSMQKVDPSGSHQNRIGESSINADRIPLRNLLGFVFGVGAQRIVGPEWLDDAYQVAAKARPGEENHFVAALEKAIMERLQLRAEHVDREMQVVVLRVTDPNSPKLHAGTGASSIRGQNGSVTVENARMNEIANMLTRPLELPVIDETNLTGRFSFDLEWQSGDTQSLRKAMREKLGLTLTDERRKIDVLQIDRK